MGRTTRQVRHVRISKKGKPFKAGKKTIVHRKRTQQYDLSSSVKKSIFQEGIANMIKDLKHNKKAKIHGVGILRIKSKRAVKGGQKRMMFGKEIVTKPRPARKVIKFTAVKALKESI